MNNNLIGQKFGRLTILKFSHKDNHSNNYYCCLCDCGKTKTIRGYSITCGSTTSCGCYINEIVKDKFTIHGLAGHALYSVWHNIKMRCNDPESKSFANYGGRGIKMCDEWSNDPKSFYDFAIANGWRKDLRIDRINNDGDYEPNNCRFVTSAENCAVGRRGKWSNNTSGYTGISWSKNRGLWVSYIIISGIRKHLGYHKELINAVSARINAEIKYFGEQKTNLEII